MAIFVVAAQILPSDTGGGKLQYVPIGRLMPPLDIQHGVTLSMPRIDWMSDAEGAALPIGDHSLVLIATASSLSR